jgi:hypothetical protein
VLAADAVPTARTILVIAIVTTLFLQKQAVKGPTPTSQSGKVSVAPDFHWNWRDGQELSAEQSLQEARLTYQRKKAIATAIAGEIRPMMSDLEIQSEPELQKAALDTRIKMIDLDGDGVPEVVAQGMVNCGATGNCPFWVFRKARAGYELVLEAEAHTFTVQKSVSNQFRDIVLDRHGSYDSGDLAHYVYRKGSYHEAGCYDYDWTVLEGDKVRKLKEPRITPCSERNISNSVGPVKSFLSALLHSLRRVVFSVVLRPLHRRPRLVCNLSVGFGPT